MTEEDDEVRRAELGLAIKLGRNVLARILTEICDADAVDYRAARDRGLVAVGHFRTAWLRAQNAVARDLASHDVSYFLTGVDDDDE